MRVPVVLLALAGLALFADVAVILRCVAAGGLVGVAAHFWMRRHGLTWGGLLGGFRRDR